jgi:hypothetical protein
MNLKVESCFTPPGRILRSLIFIISGFGAVTPRGKICLRDLTHGNPTSRGNPFAVTLAANENNQQTRTS